MRAPISSARALLCAFLAHMVRSDWQNCLSEVLKGEHARFDGEQCETAGSQGAKCANRRDHAHFRAQNCEATFDVRFEWSVYSRRVRRVQAELARGSRWKVCCANWGELMKKKLRRGHNPPCLPDPRKHREEE